MKHITEEQIDLIVDRLISRVEKANEYFLRKIGTSIQAIRKLTPTEAHQLVQILKYGDSYEEIIEKISEYTNLNIKDIDKIFEEYAKEDQSFYKQFYNYKDVPYVEYSQNDVLKRQTEALANVTKNEMYNFSRANVIGYTISNLDGTTSFLGLRETYNRLLDDALLTVSQGKETFDSAMTRIMKDVGSSGLKTLEFESGRKMRLDSAIRMHLKGRLMELHSENEQLYAKEFGADGVEISVHSFPAPDHAEVQGRQFSTNQYDEKGRLIKQGEWEKLQNGEEAKDYKGRVVQIKHSKKGSYRPINEMNCYHKAFPIVLGVSKPEYNAEQLEEIAEKNDEGFDLDGKHYTKYEGTQLQRNLERKIREQKDIQILAKSSGNSTLVSEAQLKITQLTRKYKELSDVSGLPVRADRMRVIGYKRAKV